MARRALRLLDRLGLAALAFRVLDRPVRRPALTFPLYSAKVGELTLSGNSAAWEALRRREGYALPDSREEWERSAREDGARGEAAVAIATIARGLGARRLCSYGAGTGTLELLVHLAAPDLRLVCTDVTPEAVAKLAALFPEAEVVRHDLAHDPPLAADVHLLHRVDTEFDDENLAAILARFAEPVLFVPHDLLRWARIPRHARAARAPRGVLVGWSRSERRFRLLFGERRVDRVAVGGLEAFLLR